MHSDKVTALSLNLSCVVKLGNVFSVVNVISAVVTLVILGNERCCCCLAWTGFDVIKYVFVVFK